MDRSYNSITAYLIKQLTPQLVVDYAKRMVLKGPLDSINAICLGCSDASIYEMVGAYSTFSKKGFGQNPFLLPILKINMVMYYKHLYIHEDMADLMTSIC